MMCNVINTHCTRHDLSIVIVSDTMIVVVTIVGPGPTTTTTRIVSDVHRPSAAARRVMSTDIVIFPRSGARVEGRLEDKEKKIRKQRERTRERQKKKTEKNRKQSSRNRRRGEAYIIIPLAVVARKPIIII